MWRILIYIFKAELDEGMQNVPVLSFEGMGTFFLYKSCKSAAERSFSILSLARSVSITGYALDIGFLPECGLV